MGFGDFLKNAWGATEKEVKVGLAAASLAFSAVEKNIASAVMNDVQKLVKSTEQQVKRVDSAVKNEACKIAATKIFKQVEMFPHGSISSVTSKCPLAATSSPSSVQKPNQPSPATTQSRAPQNDAVVAAQQQSLSLQGLTFIKQHEGYSDTVYKDVAGNPTIGYGHLITGDEDYSKGITEQQATALLLRDVSTAVSAVNKKVTAKVSQSQFDALVDFTYNLGSGNLGKSSLLKNVNAGNDVTKENFTDWNHAGDKVVPGLTTRRTNEFNLFSSGDYGTP